MSNYVNLTDVGVLTRSGQDYGATAEDQHGESQSFRGRMDAAHHGLKGAAGNTFGNVAHLSANNLTQLANLIVDQAVRAVRAEHTLVGADEDAHGAQQVAVANVESHATAVARPINV